MVMDMPPSLVMSSGVMSSRMVVMMSADDKHAIAVRARAQGLTPSELVRRAAREYAPADPAQEAALGVLADELETVVAGMRHDLGAALGDLDAHRAEMARIKAGAETISDRAA
jgi:hypothetical protein